MQASRASQEAPGFKIFYQANISLRRDSLAKLSGGSLMSGRA
jgi:hypothetical protein